MTITQPESSEQPPAPPPAALSLEERKAKLQHEIQRYLAAGYHVVSQTDTTAQMLKPKQFIWPLVILLAVTILGLIIPLVIYLASTDKQVYLEVEPGGQVRAMGSGVLPLAETPEARAARLAAGNQAYQQRQAARLAEEKRREAEKIAWLESHPGEAYRDPAGNKTLIIVASAGGVALLVIGCCVMMFVLAALQNS